MRYGGVGGLWMGKVDCEGEMNCRGSKHENSFSKNIEGDEGWCGWDVGVWD